jgi:hypothetical protein
MEKVGEEKVGEEGAEDGGEANWFGWYWKGGCKYDCWYCWEFSANSGGN